MQYLNFEKENIFNSSASFPIAYLKNVIWAYFLLLIFEGALRKWIFPGLASPLLIVRDPLALWIILQSWYYGCVPPNFYIQSMVFIGVLSIFTALIFGHGNIFIALFGARMFILHFPLIFIIGKIFTKDDIIQLGKLVLWISLPMLILIALQFVSPQSAWVNRGVGDDQTGAGFSGALGFFRPPGTFSFTNGNTLFYSLDACFIFYFWFNRKILNKTLLLLATFSLIAAILLSISRGLLFQVVLCALFSLIAALANPKYLKKTIITVIFCTILFIFISKTSLYQNVTKVLSARLEVANYDEGGLKGTLIDRYAGLLIESLTTAFEQPFFGYGLGMGTNVGSVLLKGHSGFLIAEEEWARIIGEIGPVLGLSVILLRVRLGIQISIASYHKMIKNDLLPWLLLSFSLILIVKGGWAQPTSLGFCTVASGLTIASLKKQS